MDAALDNMKLLGRIVLCGMISIYNDVIQKGIRTRPPANAPSLVMDRSGRASRMAAVGLPATRSHDAE